MKTTKLLFLLVTCVITTCKAADVSAQGSFEVTTPNGRIRGSMMTSRQGKDIYACRGVRYAEPPTGNQRFQVAKLANNWEGVFDATQEGPACPQIRSESPNEDCLRLNVYTTSLPKSNGTASAGLKPVLVFFHPGGFYIFSGQSKIFGPQYLMDKNIVLVTTNYRLGTLGFLSTGDSLAPGNLGLKDQVIALRWVQKNIAAFGGDPNSVTISGYSVGGLSVILHMVSPMSKGLFHKAIHMSGSDLTTELFPTEQKDIAEKQAKILNCPSNDTKEMIDCFNKKPVEDFSNSMSQFFDWQGDPIIVWKPVVEPEVAGVERFLPDQPVNLIRKGEFNQVPLISGFTKDEFGGIVVAFTNQAKQGNDSLFRYMNDNWNTIAPISFIYERGTERSKNISTQLRNFYFKNQIIGLASAQGLANIYADSVIIFPSYRATKLIATYSKAPVYFYKFTFQGRFSFAMWNSTTPYGVVHHDDLQYLFYISERFPLLNVTSPETPMKDLSTAIWANFAATGEPIPRTDIKYKYLRWDRYIPEQDNYLDLNLFPTMKTGIYPERMREWERLFPIEPRCICSS